mmetsp:Transcript_14806/g.25181  ORF Transcript_14806/g.25181 Transcript_14806/m.25181 type:complete len:346 (+) Transcript_14806:478-1515(+)
MVVLHRVKGTSLLHDFEAGSYFLEEMLSADGVIAAEEGALAQLVEAAALGRKLGERLLDQISELRRVGDIFEYLPKVLLGRGGEALKIGVRLHCLAEGRAFHLDHEQCRPAAEDVGLLSIIGRIDGELAQLFIDFVVVEGLPLRLLLEPLLQFLLTDLAVPDLGGVVYFGAHIVALLNYGVILLGEEVIAVDLLHASGEAEVGYDQPSLLVYQQVFWLDVPVNDAVRVQVLDALEQLGQQIASHSLVKALCLFDEAVELTIVSQLHHVVAELGFTLHDCVLTACPLVEVRDLGLLLGSLLMLACLRGLGLFFILVLRVRLLLVVLRRAVTVVRLGGCAGLGVMLS